MDGGGVDDYINASWVMGYGGEYEFLVTQHPLMETREQFWRMVLEKDVTSVVTMGPLGVGEEEEEEEEEEAYLPSEGVAGYGGITVELVSLTTEEGGLVVRELLVECIQVRRCMCICMYVCMYVCTYVRMYVCTYVRMYVCTYVRMYVCTYVRMYVCMYQYA